jgi:hypothetical protein
MQLVRLPQVQLGQQKISEAGTYSRLMVTRKVEPWSLGKANMNSLGVMQDSTVDAQKLVTSQKDN